MRRRRPPHVNAPTPCDRGDVRPPDAPLASLAWKWLAAPGPAAGHSRWFAGAGRAVRDPGRRIVGRGRAVGAVLSWQANAVAVNAAHARAGAAAAAVSARMRATAAALGQAARRYAGQDTAAAAALGRYARGDPLMATSGLPPLSAVQSTSFAHLSEAAAHWRRLATRWERALAEVRDSMRRPGGTDWEGQAAARAHYRSTVDVVTIGRAVDRLHDAAAVAGRGRPAGGQPAGGAGRCQRRPPGRVCRR